MRREAQQKPGQLEFEDLGRLGGLKSVEISLRAPAGTLRGGPARPEGWEQCRMQSAELGHEKARKGVMCGRGFTLEALGHVQLLVQLWLRAEYS
jgi:hypothetical protein